MSFKKGDVVLCVDSFSGAGVSCGKAYIIEEIKGNLELLMLRGVYNGYLARRFVKIEGVTKLERILWGLE